MKKEIVVISAKYGTAGIWDSWDEKPVSGTEVFNFLMSDAGMQWFNLDEKCEKYGDVGYYMYRAAKLIGKKEEYQIPGDLNIWYLGCNEKMGLIKYKDQDWLWNFGESSFGIVRAAITTMHQDDFFTGMQYHKLMKACAEGERIDNAYKIGDYLRAKSSWWKVWRKPKEWRNDSKAFFGLAKSGMESKGYKITNFGNEEVVHK